MNKRRRRRHRAANKMELDRMGMSCRVHSEKLRTHTLFYGGDAIQLCKFLIADRLVMFLLSLRKLYARRKHVVR